MTRAAMILSWAAIITFSWSCTSVREPNGKKSPPAPKPAKSQGTKAMTMKITSTAFKDGEAILPKFTGEGSDLSPPLEWSDVPEKAKELVLICDDPDAPGDEPWVHWVIYKIPAHVKGLKEGVPRKPRLTEPAGALQGKNSWPHDNIGYRGPMPPSGHGTHHYHFKLYALEGKLAVEPGMDKSAILQEIEDHVIAVGELIGTYKR
jgi:Raf kinase inhibitor-like YbhB/YbcL family protein